VAQSANLAKNTGTMKPFLFVSLLSAIAFNASSQTDSMVKFVTPAAVAKPKGYTPVVKVDLGTCYMLILSGQVPLDKQGSLVGPGDLGKQTEQVFSNIAGIIQEEGGSINNLVKITVYITDMAQIQAFRAARDKFVTLTRPPASTLVQVNKLYRDDVMVEVEGVAIILKK
jgi:enamine deaminase RidA (YjgF/YER057c/UK114 family)